MKRVVLGIGLDLRQIGPDLVLKVVVAKTPYTFRFNVKELIEVSSKSESIKLVFQHEFQKKEEANGEERSGDRQG